MTPETRAARDRIAAFLTERSGALTDTIACSGASRDATRLTASDLAAVLAALDRYEAIEDADRRAAQGVASEWAAGRTRREYDPAVRVPRDLDPGDGSVWDLPRGDEYADPTDHGSGQ